jgi:hypothetical protein
MYKKYNELGIFEKFPFRLDGPQMDDAQLLEFFDDLNALASHFGLEEVEDPINLNGEKIRLFSLAQDIAEELADNKWRTFYSQCKDLESFLFTKRASRSHEFEASMVPGPVGSSFHWVRIAYGDGIFKDINVYGEPKTEMILRANDHSVTIKGLDAARKPQASKAMTHGSHALLQMIYLHGRPAVKDRKTWFVDVELPMNENPSFNVKATFKFVFKEALPVLPDWTIIKD